MGVLTTRGKSHKGKGKGWSGCGRGRGKIIFTQPRPLAVLQVIEIQVQRIRSAIIASLWRDILIHPKDIIRIIDCLDFFQPLHFRAVVDIGQILVVPGHEIDIATRLGTGF